MKRILLTLLLFCLTITGFSQSKDEPAKRQAELKKSLFAAMDSAKAKYINQDSLMIHVSQLENQQFHTMMALEKHKLDGIDDDNFAMKHRWRTFDFQYTASIIIFVLVILIVVAGLVFSGWQFKVAVKQIELRKQLVDHATDAAAATPPAENQNNAWDALKSDLEISATGVKVSSSLLGVIILALSIAFFYLYIIYVYPVKYVSGPQVQETVKTEQTVKTTEPVKTETAPAAKPPKPTP